MSPEWKEAVLYAGIDSEASYVFPLFPIVAQLPAFSELLADMKRAISRHRKSRGDEFAGICHGDSSVAELSFWGVGDDLELTPENP